MADAWPIENDVVVWRVFRNDFWPALCFSDAEGQIRHHRFGEGDDQRSEGVVQQLAVEAGIGGIARGRVVVDARGVEAVADWAA